MSVVGQSLPRWGYLRALLMPLCTLGFFIVDPVKLWALAIGVLVPSAIDLAQGMLEARRTDVETRQPQPSRWQRAYDLPLYALFGLHLGNLVLGGLFVGHEPTLPRFIAALWLLMYGGVTSGPIAGHELIHRKGHQRWMGRILFATTLQEHFWLHHLQGHHARAGIPDDPGTAQFNESFVAYLRRGVPGQWDDARAIEKRRLLASKKSPLRNRVMHGVILQLAMLAAFGAVLGAVALVLFVAQAVLVNLFMQMLNYVDHWGIERTADQGPHHTQISWDCDRPSVVFSSLAISRHADHHAHPNRAFHELEFVPEAPKVPYSYGQAALMVFFRNAEFCLAMRAELERLGLTPARLQ